MTDAPSTTKPATAPAGAGRTLVWSVRILYAEAVVTGLITIWSVWAAVTTASVTVVSAIATSGFFALCALVLWGLGAALARKKALARGPAIVLEMLMIPIGYYMVIGGLAILGVPMIVVGLLGAGLLLAPATRAALGLTV